MADLHHDGSKVFNDPVHGHMEFDPLCVAIIDTPQFQRLRYLKQLGTCYLVYPGAAHNRFEHSLGVGLLAGQLVSELQKKQPELGITDKDIQCVQIAGLCHDLGHGPFSHLFDEIFIPATRPDKKEKWRHEDASVEMFEYMLDDDANQLRPVFQKYGLFEDDIIFIKEQISGKPLTPSSKGEAEVVTPSSKGEAEVVTSSSKEKKKFIYHYEQEKKFLYEVVANKRNGVDVDKWEYFKRDCYQLGMTSSFDHARFIKLARVIEVEGELQICVRDKEAFDVYQMFLTRLSLHRKAYQHKTVQAINVMLVEAMKAANDVIRIPGKNGESYRMSECIDHIEAYVNLTDSIFHLILMNQDQTPGMKRARQLLQDIQRRKLYKCIGESVPISSENDSNKENLRGEEIKSQILAALECDSGTKESVETRFAVQVVKLDFGGKKDQNPVDNMRFFSKDNLNKAVASRVSEVSKLLPQVFYKEQLVRVFFYPTEKEDTANKQCIQLIQEGFRKWCLENTGKEPNKMPGFGAPLTTEPQECDVNSTPEAH